MQFILRDGYIHIVNNTGLANNNIEASVVTKYVRDAKNKSFEYSVNGLPFKKIEHGKITIHKDELKKPYIDLVIQGISRAGVEAFKVERIPLTYAVILGERIDNAYPEKFHQLEAKIDRITETVKDVLSYVEELEKKGRLL